jgi:hypothetical protein
MQMRQLNNSTFSYAIKRSWPVVMFFTATTVSAFAQQTVAVIGNCTWSTPARKSIDDAVIFRKLWEVHKGNGPVNSKGQIWNVGTIRVRADRRDNQLVAMRLQPGDAADLILGVYVDGEDGPFQKAVSSLQFALNFVDGFLSAGDYPSTAIIGTEFEVAAQELSDIANESTGFVGSVEIRVWRSADGKMAWNYRPLVDAFDRGRISPGICGVGMRYGRNRDYRLNLGVRFAGGH